ncbi:DUF4873 domain-containing protein [Saccharopolyspora elongata]|uniref:DUF4873 domain-containing protein n=1 Tax=Saccharopolyspora elongata TaxID=2530387 RepID=A0A4R4Z6A1_9PSEU|nr:DUF4873 domain-containing protein [Saccharopolyspora elongata]TDD53678.1 DUF4873 domain-containing protein [Saccharopolyspora elongata]
MADHEHDEDDYRGPATLLADERELAVEVVLRGHFQPIDGRFHWYGRLSAHQDVDEFADRRKKDVVFRTPAGEATGTLSDQDPWGRYRITGTGRPPFEIPAELD